MRGLVICDVLVRSSQKASNEDVDHDSQQEVVQSSIVNPSNAPNAGIWYNLFSIFKIMCNPICMFMKLCGFEYVVHYI